MMMGIPKQAAKVALFRTGGDNPEIALSWYFENMDTPGNLHSLFNFNLVMDEPLVAKKASNKDSFP